MIEVTDIKSLTDFLRNSRSHIASLKETGKPEVLTVNGEAAVVVQDARSYQALLDMLRQTTDDARLAKALESLRKGDKGISSKTAQARLKKRFTGKRN